MGKNLAITELEIVRTHMSFLLPFGFDSRKREVIADKLVDQGYTYFQIHETFKYNATYGEDITVEGRELEQYFLPYVERKLFPASIANNGFHRFTIPIAKSFELTIRGKIIEFLVRSIDIILGPFGIAFIHLRVEMADGSHQLTDVLDFMNHFRSVEPKLDENRGAEVIVPDSASTVSIHDFIFEHLCPFLTLFILHDKDLSGYFGSLPYFEDERMYVSGFLFTTEGSPITDDQLFRIGNLNGRTPDGQPFIAASNPEYVKESNQKTVHDRWAPHTYTVTTDHAFITITDQPAELMHTELAQYMGTHYYNFLLHYFYKIMLIRVAFEYSELVWKKDEEYVKSLSKLITLFSSWYYFNEISTRSEGKELARMFRQSYNIDSLFEEVNTTLHELYRNQESGAAGRMNMLLFVLTIFTVISGIYGMNLVIQDWEKPFQWREVFSYTFFEWISLITALSGIGLSAYLVFSTFGKLFWRKLRKKKSDSHM